jgi:hypothetical protein
VTPDLNSLETLRTAHETYSFGYLVYDQMTGTAAHPRLAGVLEVGAHPEGLTPLYSTEARDLVLYRIDDDAEPDVTHSARLGEQILFKGYDLHLTQDGPGAGPYRVGVYLYWQATAAITESYKVFVHILDGTGSLIAQDDSIPVLWSAPTYSWQTNRVIIDFHSLELPATATSGDYSVRVGLYPEAHPERRLAVIAEGSGAADQIFLTTVTLDPP